MTEINLRQAFDLFDIDQNGQITPLELKHILSNASNKQDISDEEWEAIIQEFDTNGDGQINFAEFKNMMLQMNKRVSLGLVDNFDLLL